MERPSDRKLSHLHQTPTASSTISQSDSTSIQNSFQVSALSISLPESGSAIRGTAEKFAADLVTGSGLGSCRLTRHL